MLSPRKKNFPIFDRILCSQLEAGFFFFFFPLCYLHVWGMKGRLNKVRPLSYVFVLLQPDKCVCQTAAAEAAAAAAASATLSQHVESSKESLS